MQICTKCGKTLENEYDRCPYCNEQLVDDSVPETAEMVHEKIKQAQKEERDRDQAILKGFTKSYKLAVGSLLTWLLILLPLSVVLLVRGSIILTIIAVLLFVGGFCAFIYTAFIKRGFFCPFCDRLLGRPTHHHCNACGKRLF